MKFSVSVEGLKQALQPAICCATNGIRKDHPDAFKLNLKLADGKLTSEASGGYVSVINVADVKDIELESLEDGEVTIKALDLNRVLESFSDTGKVNIELKNVDGGSQLHVSKNDEEFQTLPCLTETIELPVLSTKFTKTFSMSKEDFVSASRVSDIIGWQKYKPEFLYWILRVSPKGYRSASGDGACFLVYEKEGDNIVTTKDNFNIMIYKDHSVALLKILPLIYGNDLKVSEYVAKDNDNVPNQIVFTSGNTNIILTAYDTGYNWPDELKFVNRKSKMKVVTAVKDWSPVLRGVSATYNEDMKKQDQLHVAQLKMDTGKKEIVVKVEGIMNAQRKLIIRDSEADEDSQELDYSCAATFLSQMEKNASNTSAVQMEFVDGKVPAIVRFFAPNQVSDDVWKENEHDKTRERLVMFFASTNK